MCDIFVIYQFAIMHGVFKEKWDPKEAKWWGQEPRGVTVSNGG